MKKNWSFETLWGILGKAIFFKFDSGVVLADRVKTWIKSSKVNNKMTVSKLRSTLLEFTWIYNKDHLFPPRPWRADRDPRARRPSPRRSSRPCPASSLLALNSFKWWCHNFYWSGRECIFNINKDNLSVTPQFWKYFCVENAWKS